MIFRISTAATLAATLTCSPVEAGPYSLGLNDPSNTHDAPIPGFVGPHGIGKARLENGDFDDDWNPIYDNPDNYVNPLFFGWAGEVTEYTPSDIVSPDQGDPFYALGAVTGDHFFGVVSLGDLDDEGIALGDDPGSITLELDQPVRNLSGVDFVVYENGYLASTDLGGAGIGGVFAELGYIEVSNNGEDFVRFPSTSLTTIETNAYATIDPSDVHNLAGKHVNSYSESWGTPFDLDDVGLNEITHVRIIDIPGDGSSLDQFNNPIYDPWYPLFAGTSPGTSGTGGFDLEAIGSISVAMSYGSWPQLEKLDPSERGESADPDGDGLCNLLEYAFARLPWSPDAVGSTQSGDIVTDTDGMVYEFRFIRDERLSDLTYEVQVSASLSGNNWTTIAHSTAGSPVTAANGHSPTIAETSASQIAGIDVIREVNVTETAPNGGKRFYRVKVSRQTP